MIEAKTVDENAYLETARHLGLTLPVEQLPVWQAYEATIAGRSPWGYVVLEEGGAPVALAAFMDYETHGYHYLRSHHGPVWASEPTAQQEQEALEALTALVRATDKNVVFLRCGVDHEVEASHPVLSTLPYDSTVMVDLRGNDDEILSRFKTRGRRDVRKSLRECPLTVADETAQAAEDFSEYYAVMQETGDRDGFAPAPQSDYETMLRVLGPEHARVFAGRDEEGRLRVWQLDTLNGTRGTRYYAAMATDAMKLHPSDLLAYRAMCLLAADGVEDYDLMGIGSDFQPALRGLNTFKTKFAKEVTHVAPDRDVPVRPAFYKALTGVKALRSKVRGA